MSSRCLNAKSNIYFFIILVIDIVYQYYKKIYITFGVKEKIERKIKF